MGSFFSFPPCASTTEVWIALDEEQLPKVDSPPLHRAVLRETADLTACKRRSSRMSGPHLYSRLDRGGLNWTRAVCFAYKRPMGPSCAPRLWIRLQKAAHGAAAGMRSILVIKHLVRASDCRRAGCRLDTRGLRLLVRRKLRPHGCECGR